MPLCLSLPAIILLLTTCDLGQKNNEDKTDIDRLIGKWELKEDKINGKTFDRYGGGEYVLQFDGDGTGVSLSGHYSSSPFIWETKGDALSTTNHKGMVETFTIKHLTSDSLVWDYRNNGQVWTEIYHRIK